MLVFLVGCLLASCLGRELDPAACGARFDVQHDTIIRTEESREMGARYLSELDVGSRHECRRLCCETDACDVFVYEEKSPGSCYLFKCGPPEDFRCKFTAHGNFSSGVLAISRGLAELQDQERLAAPPAPTTPPTPPTVRTTASTSTRPPPTIVHTTTTRKPHGRCSRYQWECHTGGECIAVYNACDGIPQCADGSDEAPELGCPPAPPATLPPTRAEPTAPPPPLYPAQMYESEAAAAAEAQAATLAGGERWPHRLLQAQPRRFPDTEAVSGGGPHIFSHKGGLVQQEAPLPAFEPPQPPQPWPRRPAWPQHQGLENSGWGGWGRDWADGRRAWPPAPPPAPAPREPEYPPYASGARTQPEQPLAYGSARALHDAPKKGLGLDASQHELHATAPPSVRADSSTKKKDAAVQPEPKVVPPLAPAATTAPAPGARGAGAGPAAAMRDDHDGLSERPPAAVMLLVLGVVMTGATGVLVGCRARAAHRRVRRGGKPFAHDADYLVNGMYL